MNKLLISSVKLNNLLNGTKIVSFSKTHTYPFYFSLFFSVNRTKKPVHEILNYLLIISFVPRHPRGGFLNLVVEYPDLTFFISFF